MLRNHKLTDPVPRRLSAFTPARLHDLGLLGDAVLRRHGRPKWRSCGAHTRIGKRTPGRDTERAMSQDNVEVGPRLANEASARRDREAVARLMDLEIEWTPCSATTGSGTLHGPEAVVEFIFDIRTTSRGSVDPVESVDLGMNECSFWKIRHGSPRARTSTSSSGADTIVRTVRNGLGALRPRRPSKNEALEAARLLGEQAMSAGERRRAQTRTERRIAETLRRSARSSTPRWNGISAQAQKRCEIRGAQPKLRRFRLSILSSRVGGWTNAARQTARADLRPLFVQSVLLRSSDSFQTLPHAARGLVAGAKAILGGVCSEEERPLDR